MLEITLPDNSKLKFDGPISALDIAQSIGSGLARATLVARVNGVLVDAKTIIMKDAFVALITSKDEEVIEILRHSTAHLLAMSAQSLFPGLQVTIGPVIEDGFYYDFAYKRMLTTEDLEPIEQRMKELASLNLDIVREIVSKEEAIRRFTDLGETYKVQIIKSLPEHEDISVYKQGEWMDLCRGPHVPSTGKLKVFKLLRVAGAYWRGDSSNEMLTRVYGTAWPDKASLKNYLVKCEEAKKRDHRKLGKKLDLFHFQEEAPGMVFWHANGWTIYQQLIQYMREKLRVAGYQEINTPQIASRSLWERSGHWDKYADDMFTVQSANKDMAVKPMSCPCHIQIFNQGLKSYKDLPLRLSEFGCCHRNEASGALHGLARLRGFVQDDAHIFVTEAQIQEEVAAFIDLLHEVYQDLGFQIDQLIYKLSTRPKKRVGADFIWDKSEKALADALNAKKLPWEECPGEGAFYGPKIEFSLKDCIGRVWQCGTIQVDFSMPSQLGAEYIDANGTHQVPVMLHRAVLGSFERFLAILLEHYAAELPLWLTPVQVVVLNITDKASEWAQEVYKSLLNQNIRINIDLRNEKIGFKIRNHTLMKVPYMLLVGEQEVKDRTVSIRMRSGSNLGAMSLSSVSEMLKLEIKHRKQLNSF